MFRPGHAVLVLALAVLSARTATAQRGGGGGSARGMGGDEDRFGKSKEVAAGSMIAVKLNVGDVEDMSPMRLLIDKRKDLKLTDDQLKQVKEMDAKLKETNKPHLKAFDSLRVAMRPRTGPGVDQDVERARAMMTRDELGGVLKAIRGNYDASLKEALLLLDATQAPKADELLKKQAAESEKTIRENLGGGGGRRG